MQRLAFVVMAKAPQPGTVKTRLCPPLSLQEAAELYRCFLLDTLAKVRTLSGVSCIVNYSPDDQQPVFAELAPDFILLPQHGDDLGSRMATCFLQLFTMGYAAVLLTGSDLPTLPVAYLHQAIELIKAPQNDVVLGPSEDGGYYLIGLRHLHGEFFEAMTWSTSEVLAETVRRADTKKLQVACLPPWHDIDTASDLERLQTTLVQMPGQVPHHTQQFLLRHPAGKKTLR